MWDVNQVTIVGTGLLGTSLGLAIKAEGLTGSVVGVARSRTTADAAQKTGGFDHVVLDAGEVLSESDLVVVAVPLSQFEGVFATIAQHDHPGLAITDVGSVKRPVQELAERVLPDPKRFIGAHPMAGSEKSGPEAARADLFKGKVCLICQERDHARADAWDKVTQLFRAVCSVCVFMSPADHDRDVAACSHLPHLASVLTAHAALDMTSYVLMTASTGFRDITRLASSNPKMRLDIIRSNRDAILDALECYRGELDRLIRRLDRDDADALLGWLQAAAAGRDDWLTNPDRFAERAL